MSKRNSLFAPESHTIEALLTDFDISLKFIATDTSLSIFTTLTNFASVSSIDFSTAVTPAFGSNFNTDKLEALRQQWAASDFSGLPKFEIRPAADLGGARAAFSPSTNTVYISADLLSKDSGLVQDVVLEEIGHFIDTHINHQDSPGDEGRIFAHLVQGRTLSEQQLQQLQLSDDVINITIDGQTLEVEANTDPADNLQFLPGKITDLFNSIRTILEDNIPDTSNLPIVGDKFDLKARVIGFVNQVETEIKNKLETLQDNAVDTIRQALFDALNGAGILLDSDDEGDDISINDIKTPQDANSIAFKFDVGVKLDPDISLNENLGLPNLGLNLGGGLKGDLDIKLSVGFGVDNYSNDQNAIFLETSVAKEFQAKFVGKLVDESNQPLTLEGTLGFLQIEATDRGSILTADFAADLTLEAGSDVDGNGRVRFNNLENLKIDADPLTAKADIKLFLNTGLSDPETGESLNGPLPSITSNFDLLDLQFNSDNPATPAPIVKFTDATLDFGSLITGFFKSVFEDIQRITNPFEPIIDVLTTPLPIIRASLLDIALKLVESGFLDDIATLDPETVEFVQIIVDIVNVIDSFPTNDGNLILKLGDFDLTGTDVRNDNVSDSSKVTPNVTNVQDPLSQLPTSEGNDVTPFINALIRLVNRVQESSLFQQSSQFAQSNLAFASESLQSADSEDSEESSSLKDYFPVLADPSSIFKILLGQRVDLFRYDSPRLAFSYTFEPPAIPIFGPIFLQFKGGVFANAAIAVGYDTQGFIEYRQGGFSDASKLLDGFYASRPIGDKDEDGERDHNLELGGLITAEAQLNTKAVNASIGGGLSLTVFMDLGDESNNYTVRGSEILNTIEQGQNILCLFNPSGELTFIVFGQIELDFGFFSFSRKLDLANIKLISFTPEDFEDFCFGDPSQHYNVIDKEPAPDSPLAEQLNDAGVVMRTGTDGNDIIIVEHISGNASNEVVEVRGLDPEPKRYQNVKLVVINAGDGDDVIQFINGVIAPGQIKGGSGNDSILGGLGDDFISGGSGNDTIDGGAKNKSGNTAEYSDSPGGIVVNLALGQATNDGYGTQDTLINIQNIVGSRFNDSIVGNNEKNVLQGDNGNDTLFGMGGDDVLLGGAGADYIDGGDGKDTITYIGSKAGVYVNISNSNVTFTSPIDKVLTSLPANRGFGGEANGDRIFNVENVQGSVYNDILVASDAGGNVSGLDGDDILLAGAQADNLDGGNGRDWVSYRRSNAGVNVSLLTNNNSGGYAAGDVIERASDANGDPIANRSSIENLEGSNFNDTLEGDVGNNILRGLNGNDTLRGNAGNDTLIGGAGADVLDGGTGIDWADYSESPSGVRVSLLPGAVNTGGHGEGDTFVHNGQIATVENLLGSDFGDVLIGDNGNNIINPGLSNGVLDTVNGNGGSDRLIIDYSRNDIGTGIIGGYFTGLSSAGYLYRNVSENSNTILDAVSFSNIEHLTVIGTTKDDVIRGGPGDDILLGGAGDDTIYGGRGSNVILADDGDDFVTDQNDINLGFTGTPAANSFIYLDGGRGIDTLSIDLSGKPDNIVLVSLDPLQENPNQALRLGDGSAITRFEVFKDIKTGAGNDRLTQLGRVDNIFRTGAGDDIINPGLGIDIVDGGGGIEPGGDDVGGIQDDDVLIVDYSVGDIGTGIQYADLQAFNASFDGRLYRRDTAGAILDQVTFRNIERFRITGTSQEDVIIGGDRQDTLIGNGGNDLIIANGGNDQLSGGDGNDTLIGGRGSDTLNGGDGNDILIGVDYINSPGRSAGEIDVLTGGAGADEFWLGDQDYFFYNDAVAFRDGNADYALITDFNPSEGDIIQLNGTRNNYTTVVVNGSTQIFRITTIDIEFPDRELIGIVQGVTDFDLGASYIRYVSPPPIIVLSEPSVDPVLTLLTDSPSEGTTPTFKVLSANSPEEETVTHLLTVEDANVLENLDGDFSVTQTNDASTLLSTLLGDTAGLSEFSIKLVGDRRAFGTFQNDPFGLGSGVVLSTGRVQDLASGNTADGDFSPGISVPLNFTRLSGVAGDTSDNQPGSAVFVANLSNLGFDLRSLTIGDSGSPGGAAGRFSGFDLDAIKLSRTLVTSAAQVQALPGLNVFDFSPLGTTFIPGDQTPTNNPNFIGDLVGTINGYIHNGSATLGSFDGTGSVGNPKGFASLGVNGKVGFDLTSAVSPGQPLYLYVAEAGNNGEQLDGNISVSNRSLSGLNDLSTDFGLPGAANDTISMQIEFVADPTAPLVYFQFVFGSEEFVEFGGSQFNDEFSLKLNGLDLALLSDGEAVTINNLAPTPFGYHPDFIYNPAGTGPASEQTKLDGYTKVLTFVGPTIPNEKNTLVVTVKDVRDGLLDSAVFLKAGTFGTVDPSVTLMPGVSITTRSEDGLSVAEGGKVDGFLVALKSVPTDTVTITIDPDKQLDLGQGGNNPITLTFTPQNALTPQFVSVTAVDDLIVEGDHTGIITLNVSSNDSGYNQLPLSNLTVEIEDNDEFNRIMGTPGRDTLVGTDGPDMIIGLQGQDILTGGRGYDRFVYINLTDRGDIITDFTLGEDQIDMSQLLSNLGISSANVGFNNVAQGTQITLNTDGVFRPFILVQGEGINANTLNNPNNFIF